MHDESVDRTTSGKGLVEELDLAELKALRAHGQEIPTLGEALTLAKELDLGLVVEMKEEGLEELVGRSPVRRQLYCDILTITAVYTK